EIAHYAYVRLEPQERKRWEATFEPGKPTGYGTTPEESFCEAFAGGVSGLKGQHYELAPMLAKP
ncbi:MAG TPA: hypothetical protein VLT35_03430, partial [Methanocella sp.]|nr:hypothetical protein [Methanocella sp.]